MLSDLKDSFTTAFKKPLTWVAMAVVPLIVVVFGLLYATTFSDPFERMESLPVAVINLDAGATDSDGEARNYGEELVETICDDDSALWTREDASLLDDGLENTGYYMAVVIPEDFSEKVLAGETGDPEQAEIVFYKNTRKNYLMTTASSRMESSLREAVNQQISEQYATALAEGLIDAQDGFAEAADGAGELDDGLLDAADGAEELDEGARSLADGSADLDDGIGSIAEGAATLASGLNALVVGGATLEDGLADLEDGGSSLVEGAESLESGSGELEDGLASLDSGASSLVAGLQTLAEGAESLEAGVGTLGDGLAALDAQGSTLTGASASVTSGLSSLESGSQAFEAAVESSMENISAQLDGVETDQALAAAQASYESALADYAAAVASAAAAGEDPSTVDASALEAAVLALTQASAASGSWEALSAVQSAYGDVASGISTLNSQYATLDSGLASYASAVGALSSGASTAEAGAESLADGLTSALSGAEAVAAGTSTAAAGTSALASGSAALLDGAELLEAGAASASTGASSLTDGLASALSGAATLQAGSSDAQAGAESLAEGASDLQEGVAALSDGLADAEGGASELTEALSDSAVTIADSLATDADSMGEYVAEPVELTDEIYGELDRFGLGLAPLFLSLCLWLGELMGFFIFDPFPSRDYRGRGRARAIFARWPLYLVLAALNVAALSIACAAADLQCTSWPLLVLLFACMAFAFMCIMQLLNLFDVVGKAIAVLLVIVQLVFCSGTFPAELGSDLAQAAGPLLPFYYSIDAVREVMSGTTPAVAFQDMGMLLAFAAGAVALSLLLYPAALKMRQKNDAGMVCATTGLSPEELQAAAGGAGACTRLAPDPQS